jgi:predicted nuclease of restriction endonuclease-like (RecB) superfamily
MPSPYQNKSLKAVLAMFWEPQLLHGKRGMSEIQPSSNNYNQLLVEIEQQIRAAQSAALKAVNRELIALYWEIDRAIVDRQQTAGWGKSIVDRLAKDIQVKFPGISGFSSRNLWNMRNFYLTYHQSQKLHPIVAEISWTHNLVISADSWRSRLFYRFIALSS